ncbi:hypothetical protein [Sagittula salina]|uniref:Uncharacterized protein n=1 Tax=Sagittula salina TaxID=2820268 RepID=A0A940S2V0_9RHOB|nr:hypothetical protein [Sagittula salina]MBP0484472.1 hypothetical protein [Sagittula salina]
MAIKAVYLMRDPVERAWWAVCMYRKKPGKFRYQLAQVAGDSEEAHLLQAVEGASLARNGDYRTAVTRLRVVFARRGAASGSLRDPVHP